MIPHRPQHFVGGGGVEEMQDVGGGFSADLAGAEIDDRRAKGAGLTNAGRRVSNDETSVGCDDGGEMKLCESRRSDFNGF